MDDLLREFLTETSESLERVDAELVRFEQEPNNGEILGNIFRLVHTIKGTCGFLALPRLETLAHAAEHLIGKFRDGMPVTTGAVTLVLSTIDRIKLILDAIEAHQREPAGDDRDLIEELNQFTRAGRRETATCAAHDDPPPRAGARAAARAGQAAVAEKSDGRSAANGSPAIRSAFTSRRSII